MDAATPTESVSGGTPTPPAGVLDELSNVLHCTRETLSGFLDLFSLEARRAGVALAWMLVTGIVAALCIATGWMWLMAGVALLAIALGLAPMAAAIVTAAISLAAGAALIFWCVGASRDLLFRATRRQLAGMSTTRPTPK